MSDTKDKGENIDLTFEEAMDKLEQISGKLEQGDVSLEDSIKLYTEGMRLSKICNDKIEKIEKKIAMLAEDATGEIHEVEFEE